MSLILPPLASPNVVLALFSLSGQLALLFYSLYFFTFSTFLHFYFFDGRPQHNTVFSLYRLRIAYTFFTDWLSLRILFIFYFFTFYFFYFFHFFILFFILFGVDSGKSAETPGKQSFFTHHGNSSILWEHQKTLPFPFCLYTFHFFHLAPNASYFFTHRISFVRSPEKTFAGDRE